jgi:hypothetical protein
MVDLLIRLHAESPESRKWLHRPFYDDFSYDLPNYQKEFPSTFKRLDMVDIYRERNHGYYPLSNLFKFAYFYPKAFYKSLMYMIEVEEENGEIIYNLANLNNVVAKRKLNEIVHYNDEKHSFGDYFAQLYQKRPQDKPTMFLLALLGVVDPKYVNLEPVMQGLVTRIKLQLQEIEKEQRALSSVSLDEFMPLMHQQQRLCKEIGKQYDFSELAGMYFYLTQQNVSDITVYVLASMTKEKLCEEIYNLITAKLETKK